MKTSTIKKGILKLYVCLYRYMRFKINLQELETVKYLQVLLCREYSIAEKHKKNVLIQEIIEEMAISSLPYFSILHHS